ncbi:hypothetical protein GWK48_05785 [Metallosphaera tengchongensis]|uniref:Cobalt ABC transporter permease n=1 Tax=Metallosphaera tengchongensis TaxID=1532350 RepID=A0A6N0NSY2_9CREN|nr:hypothetical protein [Metallosphaera tengchongensis]QKQ99953.1 hypothetical protein GWK48_05785 [Metallosphaera tengchongensis]
MKWKAIYALFFAVAVVISTLVFPLWSLLTLLILLVKRKLIVIVELIALAVSFVSLYFLSHLGIYTYVMRAFVYIDLFLALSEYIDKVSVLSITGERGVPIVVTLSYIPFFYNVARDVFFYRNSRRRRFNLEELSRPILVEMVRVAENLYKAYVVKLYGNFNRNFELSPGKGDMLPIILGVVLICLPFLIHTFPVN